VNQHILLATYLSYYNKYSRSNVDIHSEPPQSIPSDHYIITFDAQAINHVVHHNKVVASFNFAIGDYDCLCYFSSSLDSSPCFESNDIEHVWCYISDLT